MIKPIEGEEMSSSSVRIKKMKRPGTFFPASGRLVWA
jgi:hypothetical protein